jgi:hypothetical protein
MPASFSNATAAPATAAPILSKNRVKKNKFVESDRTGNAFPAVRQSRDNRTARRLCFGRFGIILGVCPGDGSNRANRWPLRTEGRKRPPVSIGRQTAGFKKAAAETGGGFTAWKR